MTQADLRERAEKRFKEIKDFYSHLTAYVLICILLLVIDLATGSDGNTFLGLNWAHWPIFGWGIAVAFHAVSVFDWEERKVRQYMEREAEHEENRRQRSL